MQWPTALIPALESSAVVLAIIGFVLGVPYRRLVEGSISKQFDKKLEETRAEFRREEEKLKAELRERAAELDALRSGALSSLATRHAELAKRRILAVERIWARVTEMANLKTLSKFAEAIDMNAALEIAEKGGPQARKTSEFAEMLMNSVGVDPAKKPEYLADRERPFVPEITWALYSAYSQLLHIPLFQLTTIKFGAPSKILAGPEQMKNILKQSLPHLTQFIDEHGANGFPFLADELEQTLLRSLREALEQRDADTHAVAQAKRILDAVREAANKSEPEPPTSSK